MKYRVSGKSLSVGIGKSREILNEKFVCFRIRLNFGALVFTRPLVGDAFNNLARVVGTFAHSFFNRSKSAITFLLPGMINASGEPIS